MHKGSDYPIGERIAYYLQRTTELEEARTLIQSSIAPKLEETNILLSVIPKPRRRREKFKSDIFNIYDVSVAPPKDILKVTLAPYCKKNTIEHFRTIKYRHRTLQPLNFLFRTQTIIHCPIEQICDFHDAAIDDYNIMVVFILKLSQTANLPFSSLLQISPI